MIFRSINDHPTKEESGKHSPIISHISFNQINASRNWREGFAVTDWESINDHPRKESKRGRIRKTFFRAKREEPGKHSPKQTGKNQGNAFYKADCEDSGKNSPKRTVKNQIKKHSPIISLISFNQMQKLEGSRKRCGNVLRITT
jgi:hypothetical protein